MLTAMHARMHAGAHAHRAHTCTHVMHTACAQACVRKRTHMDAHAGKVKSNK
jgi:hypothetical protein